MKASTDTLRMLLKVRESEALLQWPREVVLLGLPSLGSGLRCRTSGVSPSQCDFIYNLGYIYSEPGLMCSYLLGLAF